jgi:hypothetical protein
VEDATGKAKQTDIYYIGVLDGHLGYDLVAADIDADDLPDLVVGHPRSDLVEADSDWVGSVEIWRAASGDWSTVYGETYADDARTGHAVASADLDGDGTDDLVIGAPGWGFDGSDGATKQRGAAYVVSGNQRWSSAMTIEAIFDYRGVGELAGDFAGAAVAVAGDVDGDGSPEVIVGAPRRAEGGYDRGGAYVLRGPFKGDASLASGWGRLLGAEPDDQAGTSVAGLGDANGDGKAELVVGAVGHDRPAPDAGAVYVVYGFEGGTADLADSGAVLEGEADAAAAGSSLASNGDANGDGASDLLVGSSGLGGVGAAYLVLGGGP